MKLARKLRADLSGAVIPIIATAAIISAALGVFVYFYWLAPNASKMPTLTIVGEPALQVSGPDADGYYTVTVYAAFKNSGNDNVTVQKLIIVDDNGNRFELTPDQTTISAGQKVAVTFSMSTNTTTPSFGNLSYEATVVTDGGTFPISVYVTG